MVCSDDLCFVVVSCCCFDVAGDDCLKSVACDGSNPPSLLPSAVESRWCEVGVKGCDVGDDFGDH